MAIEMLITVKMRAPEYARGDYKFDSLEKLFDFLLLIKSVGKRNLGPYIFALAKDGRLNISKYGFSMNAETDCQDYALANTLVRKNDVRFTTDIEKIRIFCKAFDTAKSQG